MRLKRSVQFKALVQCHPILLLIIAHANFFSWKNGVNPVITEVVSTKDIDMLEGRVSLTHQEGRAFDISLKGIQEDFIDDIKSELWANFGEFSAVNEKGEPVLIVDHDSGSGRHLHVQIHSKYKWPVFDESLYVSQ